MILVSLFPVMLLATRAALLDGVAAQTPTFVHTDPHTGGPVVCDSCAPGTYLSASCTSTRKSVCAPCPPGSFTELWNYIGRCLRCGVCGQNQVEKTACTAKSDCQCQCKQGFYYRDADEMCVRHSECPVGQQVLSKGTADNDTVCHTCPNGTYSDTASALQNCREHKSCDAAGLHLVLKGSAWHDSLCTTCQELRSKDGANHLKEILPAFFVHQRISIKRLRLIVSKLPSEDGKKQARTLRLNLSDLHERINVWVASATAKQIRELPEVLNKAGASGAGDKLLQKLQRIDSGLTELCGLDNEVEL